MLQGTTFHNAGKEVPVLFGTWYASRELSALKDKPIFLSTYMRAAQLLSVHELGGDFPTPV